MEAYAGIDLHSSNSYIGIIDEHDRRHFSKRLLNSLTQILVTPFHSPAECLILQAHGLRSLGKVLDRDFSCLTIVLLLHYEKVS